MSDARAWRVLLASLVALALGACASSSGSKSEAPPAATATAAESAPAVAPAAPPAAAADEFKALAGANQGVVVFFRPKNYMGGAIRFKVREGARELGKLTVGTFFAVPLDAGAHEFTVHSEAKDVLNIEVTPGEVYYVQGTITMGLMVGRPNIAPSDSATFNGMRAKLKPSPPLE